MKLLTDTCVASLVLNVPCFYSHLNGVSRAWLHSLALQLKEFLWYWRKIFFYLNLLLLSCSPIEVIDELLSSNCYHVPPKICLYVAKNIELFPQIFMTAALHLCSATGISASPQLCWGLVPGRKVWSAQVESLPVLGWEKVCLTCLTEDNALLLLYMVFATSTAVWEKNSQTFCWPHGSETSSKSNICFLCFLKRSILLNSGCQNSC